ncbi:hypothetical protein NQ315_004802, partial [Exocentrus adspersus]
NKVFSRSRISYLIDRQQYLPTFLDYESRVVTATTSKPNLADTLPWLASTLNPNGTLTVGQSTYELEGSSPVGPDIECQKTPLNATETGTCTLLSNCLEVHPYLTDFVVYQRYFCTVNNAYNILSTVKVMTVIPEIPCIIFCIKRDMNYLLQICWSLLSKKSSSGSNPLTDIDLHRVLEDC